MNELREVVDWKVVLLLKKCSQASESSLKKSWGLFFSKATKTRGAAAPEGALQKKTACHTMCKIFRTTNHDKELYQEAVVRMRSIKKLFLKFCKIHKKHLFWSLFLPAILLK